MDALLECVDRSLIQTGTQGKTHRGLTPCVQTPSPLVSVEAEGADLQLESTPNLDLVDGSGCGEHPNASLTTALSGYGAPQSAQGSAGWIESLRGRGLR